MKKKRCMYWMLILMVVLLTDSLNASGWSEPVLLEELHTEWSAATTPCLSSDGMTIYFRRNDHSGLKRLVEAYRETPNGPFTTERVIDEISPTRKVYSPWVSQDGLRLYYSRYDGGTTLLIIRMSHRESTEDHWSGTQAFHEIHVNGKDDKFPSLTGDELTMFFYSNRSGKVCIWQASRPSMDDPFSSPTLVSELNDGEGSSTPCVLPDGLTIYFSSNRDGHATSDIYRATRSTMSEPFGDIQRVWVSTDLYLEGGPYVTPDEKSIYYYSDRGEEGAGIWFTHRIINDIAVDIMPGSCPNPLRVNFKGNGVISVAILGTEELNVGDIDVATIALEGVSPERSNFQDISTPIEGQGEECECMTESGPDGFMDLVLKFNRKDIVTALEASLGDLNEIEHKTDVPLYLTAMLMDEETMSEGTDCVRLLTNGRIKRVVGARKMK